MLRTLYHWLKRMDDQVSESELAHRIQHVLERLLPLAILTLIIVLYLEFFGHLTHAQHEQVLLAEKLLLTYFILELVVEMGIYESNRRFVKHRWLDILLVLPFFTVLKSVGGALRALKLLKPAKAAKTTKAATVGKTAKAGKTAHAAKGSTQAARETALGTRSIVKNAKGAQHGMKAAKKSKEILLDLLPFADE